LCFLIIVLNHLFSKQQNKMFCSGSRGSLNTQWWATVTFKVMTLPLPLLKKKIAKLPLQLH